MTASDDALPPADESPPAASPPAARHVAKPPTAPRPSTGGGSVDAQLLAILRAERRPHSADELAERTGIPVRTVQRGLGKLVEDREIRKCGGRMFAAAKYPPKR